MARVPFERRFAGDHYHPHSRSHPAGAPRGEPRRRTGAILTIATVVLLATWSGAAAIYVLFRDDALRLLADRQVALVRTYDKEVGALLTEIERLKSVKLLDQQRVERTLADLMRRQVTLEQRQAALSALASTKAMRPAEEVTGTITAPVPASAPKPQPLSEALPRERRTEAAPPPASAFDRQIAELSEKLVRAEVTQTRVLDGVERGYSGRVTRMRLALAELGLPTPQDSSLTRFSNAMGGPFLPFFRTDDPFERQMSRIRLATREFETLAQTFDAVPVRRPTRAALEVTSGYGMRLDPFLRQLALHTGVDLRAEWGDPVRAAAGGKVTQASWQGGYGIMVEIDHGNGLATRYAHLSVADVAEGTTIPAGRVIGRTGTTGRSTGPHLHYEIRMNGDTIDPMRFLKVGARLSDGF